MGYRTKQSKDGSQYKINDGNWKDFPKNIKDKTTEEKNDWLQKMKMEKMEKIKQDKIEREKELKENELKMKKKMTKVKGSGRKKSVKGKDKKEDK